jgi:hypothetical protein
MYNVQLPWCRAGQISGSEPKLGGHELDPACAARHVLGRGGGEGSNRFPRRGENCHDMTTDSCIDHETAN